jgi:hypothetical protein
VSVNNAVLGGMIAIGEPVVALRANLDLSLAKR